MVDNSGRDGSHIEIGHSVGSDHHGASLLVEGFHDLTQGMLVTVYIIAIQLDGELAASRMVYSYIPATPDAEVVTLRLDMDSTERIASSIVRTRLRTGIITEASV